MRYAILGLSMLLGSATVATPAMAQVSVSVSIPGVSIGIHQPVYPDLVLVPGSPVYYAPQVQANYFFYDGLYWVFQDDNWYVSSWYNGPWDLVEPDDVPLFVLRVPVQYYVRPPVFFHTWIVTAPPRWHYHWGPRWTRYHQGWDHWDRHAIPAPAPLPVYQRHYAGDRYPRREYQRVIRHEHYHYQSRDRIVRRHDQQRAAPRPQVHAQPGAHNRPAQQRPDASREQRPQREREQARRSEPLQVLPQQRAQQQLQPQRQEPPRQVQAPVQPSPVQQAPQGRPDTPRPQRAPREREQMQRTEALQLLPQQRAAIQAQRAQPQPQRAQPQPQRAQPQPRQTPEQRVPQAPRPQQAQGREPQNRVDRQSRDNAERRGDRGPGRG